MRLSTLVAALVLLGSFAVMLLFPQGIPGDRNPGLSHGVLVALFFVSLAVVGYRLGGAVARRRGSAPKE